MGLGHSQPRGSSSFVGCIHFRLPSNYLKSFLSRVSLWDISVHVSQIPAYIVRALLG